MSSLALGGAVLGALAVVGTALTTFLWGTPAWAPPLALVLMVVCLWWGIWAVSRLEARR